MIAANECVASHIYFMNLPFVYRVHEKPDPDKMSGFFDFLGGDEAATDNDDSTLRPHHQSLPLLQQIPTYWYCNSLR